VQVESKKLNEAKRMNVYKDDFFSTGFQNSEPKPFSRQPRFSIAKSLEFTNTKPLQRTRIAGGFKNRPFGDRMRDDYSTDVMSRQGRRLSQIGPDY